MTVVENTFAMVRAPRTGLLLTNLGTPDKPDAPEVRRYLRQFLSDPRVVDIHPVGRWLLLNLIILPTRPAKSAHAYRRIWTERGSPLLFHSMDLVERVRGIVGPNVPVALGMRYGQPSLQSALRTLQAAHVDRIVVFPLYPQYAASTTGSTLDEVFRLLSLSWNVMPVHVVEPFYAQLEFIAAFANIARVVLDSFRADHVLFSFHGVPERHLLRGAPKGARCFEPGCCDRITDVNRLCYRAQCQATANLLAAQLGLEEGKHSLAFQSRLGRTKWIGPYTEETLIALARKGARRLAVMCPAFVADCLETLEEIGMRGREVFKEAGGEELVLIPSLNSSPDWADAIVHLTARSSRWIAG